MLAKKAQDMLDVLANKYQIITLSKGLNSYLDTSTTKRWEPLKKPWEGYVSFSFVPF